MAKRSKSRHGGGAGQGAASGKTGGRYWIYGPHAVLAACQNPDRIVHQVIATRNQPAPPDMGKRGLEVQWVEAADLTRRLPADAVHQGIACEVDPLDTPDLLEVLASKRPIIALDQVSDPHNIGAILRSAAAFDVAAVVMPKDHAPGESAVMAKSASGALDMVPLVYVTNLAAALDEMKKHGYWIAGLDGRSNTPISKARDYNPLCLVMGAEGKGLRRLSEERCDVTLAIPMSNRMESLNVSNAAAIALSHLYDAAAEKD